MRWFPLLLVSSLAVLVLAGCGEDKGIEDNAEKSRLKVQVVTLKSEPWSYTLEAFGLLQSAETVNVSAEAAGTVTEVFVSEGSAVKKGDILLSLDKEKVALRLQRAQAAVASIAADLRQAESQLEKFEKLGERGAVSRDVLDQSKSNRDSLQARLDQAAAEAEIAQRDLDDRDVNSPIDGVVESEPVEAGERVQAGQPILSIQANAALQVATFVNQTEVNQIRSGDSAKVITATDGVEHMAYVESVGRSANPRTGNFEVKLRLADSDPRLREGMSAQVRLPIQSSKNVIWIPRNAITDVERKQVVFIENNGVAEQRAPELGLPERDRFPVLSGLKAGERLVIYPLDFLTAGVHVDVEQTERK